MSGFDTNVFTAHSTRSASSSAAADSGITASDILEAADWSSESIFRKFNTALLITLYTAKQYYLKSTGET